MSHQYFELAGLLVCLLLFGGVIWRSSKSLASRLLLTAVLLSIPLSLFLYGTIRGESQVLYAASIPTVLESCIQRGVPDQAIAAALKHPDRETVFRELWALNVAASKPGREEAPQ